MPDPSFLPAPDRLSAAEIKLCRRKLRLTQKQLAEIIGCAHLTVSFWERDRQRPRASADAIMQQLFRIGSPEDLRRENVIVTRPPNLDVYRRLARQGLLP